MIKINIQAETIGGAFGIPEQRGNELADLLQAAANAFIRNLINSNEPRICLDKIKIVELFATYAENESEMAFCIFHAGQVANGTEQYLIDNYQKSIKQ